MIAVEVEFLTGRYVATRHDDREQGEWPPHPSRLLYALVATAGPDRTRDEEAALEWLCEQPPPGIAFADGWPRTTVTSYVPVNDRAAPDSRAATGTLPRLRQARTFPTVVPESPTVTYVWSDSDPAAAIRTAVGSLAARLVYLGHSSSLARAAVVDQAPPPTLLPGSNGRLLRVPSQGLVSALDGALARYEATGVRGPLPTGYASYRLPEQAQPPRVFSVFEEMLVLRREGGPRVPLAAAEQVATSFRAAVLSLVPDPVPDEITGHGPEGAPLEQPHVAFVALPDVGHRHASGTLLGVAAILPREIDGASRAALLTALAHMSELRISRAVSWSVEPARIQSERPLARGLQTETWSRLARRYGTATPIELDRYVDDRLGVEAEAVVATSAEHIGLPRPRRVRLSPVSPLGGGGHIGDIRRSGDRPRRPLVHAIVDFGEEVEGPVLLGSSRYRGLGLCRPLEQS